MVRRQIWSFFRDADSPQRFLAGSINDLQQAINGLIRRGYGRLNSEQTLLLQVGLCFILLHRYTTDITPPFQRPLVRRSHLLLS